MCEDETCTWEAQAHHNRYSPGYHVVPGVVRLDCGFSVRLGVRISGLGVDKVMSVRVHML